MTGKDNLLNSEEEKKSERFGEDQPIKGGYEPPRAMTE